MRQILELLKKLKCLNLCLRQQELEPNLHRDQEDLMNNLINIEKGVEAQMFPPMDMHRLVLESWEDLLNPQQIT
jgi:hypothetical protein